MNFISDYLLVLGFKVDESFPQFGIQIVDYFLESNTFTLWPYSYYVDVDDQLGIRSGNIVHLHIDQ